MPLDTALTRKLGISSELHQYPSIFLWLIFETVPVVQGGLQWVAYAELAAAVSNAGGLGIVSYHFDSNCHLLT